MKRLLVIWVVCVVLSVVNHGGLMAHEVYSGSSVLNSGKWFKIAIKESGVYRIYYSKLQQLGLANPSNPKIYGNNSGQLSYYNNDPKPDDLKEISVFLVKGSDGIFNEGDYMLFYGKGVNRWNYSSVTNDYSYTGHNYSDSAFYFITSSALPGKEIINSPVITDPAGYSSGSYDALFNHESDNENLIKSGREWFQPVSAINGITIDPKFTDIITTENISFSYRVLARSSIPTMFRLYEGESVKSGTLVPEVYLLSSTGTFASESAVSFEALPATTAPVFVMRFYNNGEQGAKGWIDYVRLHGRALTSFKGKILEFSDSRAVVPSQVTEFTVKSTAADFHIWDISDPFRPKIIQYSGSGDNYTFKAKTDSLKTFVAFIDENALTPQIRTKPVPNQNIHASGEADMIIVTHPLFRKYSEQIAEIHYANNGLLSLIVSTDEIYNEFSGGIPDIAAIRNFVRMKFVRQKGTGHPLKYLLLFGDGSYENKTLPPHNPNFIPTWQSQNSTVIVSSFTSDDFFGLLEDDEGEADGTEDIGIGRFPVSDTSQAAVMVSKVRKYLSEGSTGDWRNVICISADDEDGNTHMNDAEGLYNLLNTSYPAFNIDKIYLDAFKQITSVNGQSYPDVTKAIDDRINSGCLIFNYLGHGNEIGLAHERVVKTENINSWKNGSRLPLFITATCEFSRFDDVDISPVTREMNGKNSAGEMVLLNRDGGGIALMTTTRVVYSAPNYTLNRNIYTYAFTRDTDGNSLCLGDIIMLAKRNSGNGMNKRNFLLLGDPAVKLAYPWHGKLVTDSINSIPVSQPSDSLKALSLIRVSGHVEDNNGLTENNFNGIVYPLVFDKTNKIRTLANDGGQTMEFDLRNNILFSGKTMASEGKFSFSFIVPKDIDYSFGNGKISFYASGDGKDFGGNYNGIIVGGFSNAVINDTAGPKIRLFLNDTLFRSGGISNEDPVLLAVIEDDGGINTTGTGIGHDLTAFLDNNRNKSFVLNNYFETDLDNYMKGRVTYPLGSITSGSHSLTLKAWDNFNNSAEASLRFIVKSDNGFIINNLLNYPNPFSDQTSITAEHNRPDENLEIRINIYNMSGKLVKIIETSVFSTGYRLPPIFWDGLLDGGLKAGRGIYPYSVTIKTEGKEISKASGRMIIL